MGNIILGFWRFINHFFKVLCDIRQSCVWNRQRIYVCFSLYILSLAQVVGIVLVNFLGRWQCFLGLWGLCLGPCGPCLHLVCFFGIMCVSSRVILGACGCFCSKIQGPPWPIRQGLLDASLLHVQQGPFHDFWVLRASCTCPSWFRRGKQSSCWQCCGSGSALQSFSQRLKPISSTNLTLQKFRS